MAHVAITSRSDQIDALTRGKSLPFRAIDPVLLEIIADGLRCAYQEISKCYSATVISGDEISITTLLEARFNDLVQRDQYLSQLIMSVSRGKESVSFDGAHIEKRPDFSIFLSDRDRSFPLIVEAKILDTATAKTIRMYCDDGLCRFLVGDYAWANQEAFMLAYVRDGSIIDKRLTPLLRKDKVRYAVQALSMVSSDGNLVLSQHTRAFQYPGRVAPENDPGSITVWHLWLQ